MQVLWEKVAGGAQIINCYQILPLRVPWFAGSFI